MNITRGGGIILDTLFKRKKEKANIFILNLSVLPKMRKKKEKKIESKRMLTKKFLLFVASCSLRQDKLRMRVMSCSVIVTNALENHILTQSLIFQRKISKVD
jgi:hypothetical protein